MIVLRPRPIFRKRAGRPIVKVTRAERAANLQARATLADGLEGIFAELFESLAVDVQDALNAQVAQGLPLTVPVGAFGRFDDQLQLELLQALNEAIRVGSTVGARFTGVPGLGVDDALIQQGAEAWLANVGAERVVQISNQTKDGLRATIGRVATDAISPEDAANRIGQQTGLTRLQGAAVDRERQRLLDQRVRIVQRDAFPDTVRGQERFDAAVARAQRGVETEVERFRDRKIRERGRTIVEHEMQVAVQEGERQFYEIAIREGNVDAGLILKRWFTVNDNRVCRICEPLHGQVAKFDESFSSLSFTGLMPPAHIKCRCFLEYAPLGEFDPLEEAGG